MLDSRKMTAFLPATPVKGSVTCVSGWFWPAIAHTHHQVCQWQTYSWIYDWWTNTVDKSTAVGKHINLSYCCSTLLWHTCWHNELQCAALEVMDVIIVQVNLTRYRDMNAIGWDVGKDVVTKFNMAMHTKVPGRCGETREGVVEDISLVRQTPNQELW